MFKYKIVKETPKGFGYKKEVLLKTKDRKELQAKLPDIKQIEDKVRQAWIEDREKLKNLPMSDEEIVPVIYSVYEMRIPLFDPKNPPDELLFLEIEYYPFYPLKRIIENKIKKPLKASINYKIILSENKKRNRVVLKRYKAGEEKGEKGKQISLFTTTNLQILPYLKALVELSERWKQ